MSSQHSCCVFGDAVMPSAAEVACSDCGLDPLCLVLDYAEAGSGVPEGTLLRRQRVASGASLFKAGQPFVAVYAVKSGSFKALMPDPRNQPRVVGFYFAGELIGAEGIAEHRYACSVRAMEESRVCVLNLERLNLAGRPQAAVQRALIEMLGREVALNQQLMVSLVRQTAEQRMAAFLVSLADRFKRRGFSTEVIDMRMSRSDIGSYLGLARETVSRLLTRFQRSGLLRLRGRQLHLLDSDALRLIAISD